MDLLGNSVFDQPPLRISADHVFRFELEVIGEDSGGLDGSALEEYLPKRLISITLICGCTFAVYHRARFVVGLFNFYGFPLWVD